MAGKIFVEINADAYVEERGKQITGIYECTITEGKRLVERLKVATYSKRKPVSEVPTKESKLDIIKAWLDARDVKYNTSATKEELLVLVSENLNTEKV